MEDALVLRGSDGRSQPHDKPIGVFFGGDPQTDTLMPASLLNGFALEGQPPRISADILFPFLEMMIKCFAEDRSNMGVQSVGERFLGVLTTSLADGGRLEQAVAEHKQEVSTFKRNRVEYPYNLLRDFVDLADDETSDKVGAPATPGKESEAERPRLLRHSSGHGNIVAYQLSTLPSLEQMVLDWSHGLLVQKLALEIAPAALPDFVVLQLGHYRPDSVGGGTVVVFLQLALDRITLIDRYTNEHHAPTLTLLHLGPVTAPIRREDFFDDMEELEEAIATRQIFGVPVIKRLRFWQSRADSHHKGAIVAFQGIYTDSVDPNTEIRTSMRGHRAGAQFFVDITLGEGEFIRQISCFYVAGLYGSMAIKTNVGSYSVGTRETGSHHSIEIPRQELFDAMAFVGETGRDGTLTSLKLIAVQPHHFGTACGPKPPLQEMHVELGAGSHRKISLPNSATMAERSTMSEGSSISDRQRVSYHQNAAPQNRIMAGQVRVRPSSALSRTGTSPLDLDASSRPRPQSAMALQSAARTNDGAHSRSAGATAQPKSAVAVTEFEKNLELTSIRVHPNDEPGTKIGRRLRVLANDAQVDALLKPNGEDALLDWKQSIRNSIAQGIITAQTRFVLQVEYCIAPRPSSTLRGSKEQYSRIVLDLKEKITTSLWEYNTTVLDNRKFEYWAEDNTCITTPILKPRIGSCEIVLSWQHRSSPKSIVIHSKLQSRKWPIVDMIVDELQSCLPVQYHDIRFLAQSSSQSTSPRGARFTVIMHEGSDPLGLINKRATAVADADGVAHISLPVGLYEVKVDHENFLPHTFDYRLQSNEYKPFSRIILHPKCAKDEIKISLIWNESPSDLDLYAVTPYTKVWHQRRQDPHTDCKMGEDARQGFGPEVISFQRLSKEQHTNHLRQGRTSTLKIYVHNYSEECDLTESGAVLTVMGETGILHQMEVPKTGAGDFWDACSIDMRHVHCVETNRLVPSEPVFDIRLPEGETTPEGGNLIKSTDSQMGSASEFTKEAFAVSPKNKGILFRSVSLLHDYHNYNGIR